MPIFTKQFANADEYEEWLRKAGARISLLSVLNSPTTSGSSTQPNTAPITIKFETDDRSFAPTGSTMAMIAEIVIVAAVFFALFLYLISLI